MELESCTTWECVNSFSSWIAAFGTIVISALALWLSVKDRMISLSARFDTVITAGQIANVLDRHGFMLSYTNVGRRPVTVVGHAWSVPFRKSKLILMPQMDPEIAHLCTNLPTELSDGKTGHIFYKLNFFSELEQPELVLFHSNRLVAFLRIKFFKIRIATSVGKDIRVRVTRNARRRLWILYSAKLGTS